MNYFKKKKISLPYHYSKLTNKFAEMIVEKKLKANAFHIKLKVKPFENSLEYEILFSQEKNQQPKTYILNPSVFKLTNGKKPPHTYEFNENACRLCLNLPSEVDTSKYYDYVIPWISDWLAYFEIWLITGEWYGGGHSCDEDNKKD